MTYRSTKKKPKKHYSKIRRIDDSQGIIIPEKAKDFGFPLGQRVQILFEENKIIIIPSEMRKYGSPIRDIIIEGDIIYPVHHDSYDLNKTSIRFDLKFSVEREKSICAIFYDHLEGKFLGFVREKTVTAEWHGRYLSEEAVKDIDNGANPYKYLSL